MRGSYNSVRNVVRGGLKWAAVCIAFTSMAYGRSGFEASGSHQDAETIADCILAIEGLGDPNASALSKLHIIIDRAAAFFGPVRAEEDEAETARRFFRAVDRALVENEVIFPPDGEVDFLREGLGAHSLSAQDYARAEARFANARRLPWMRENQQEGGAFAFLDCDLAAIVYLAVAERLKLPVHMVELPGHTFVRWQSPRVSLNWDPNDAISYPDDHYIRTWRVPLVAAVWPCYFENLSRERVLSTWRVLCGREKSSRGDFEGARSDFRGAVMMDPTNLGAVNELAWLLATCPVTSIRNGREALALAESNVSRARRAVWLQTLGAAQAEVGDFQSAIASEEASQQITEPALGAVGPREYLRSHEPMLAAYRRKQTLAK